MSFNADDDRYRKLGPGMYAGHGDKLYLDVGELLAYNNVPDTPGNSERVVTGARLVLDALGIYVEER